MKNTVKNLINQVKKALANRSSFGAFEKAYADNEGNLIARSIDNNADILVFVGGIIESLEARNKVYTKDALTLAADTGAFKGGSELPENYGDVYELPAEDFHKVCEVAAADLKAAAYTASKDNTRPVLTSIHITPGGILESVDGFRAYRKPGIKLNLEALTDFEKTDGLKISAAAAAYGFKGVIEVLASDKYIMLKDNSGLILYIRKLEGQYIKLDNIFTDNHRIAATAKIKDIKGFAAILKTAKAAQNKADRNARGIYFRIRDGFLDYYIPALEIYGSVEALTEVNETENYNLVNATYLYDAVINQGCNSFEIQPSKQAPIYIKGDDNARALVLPIRMDGVNPFYNYKPEADRTEEAAAEEMPETVTPAAEVAEVVTVADDTPEAPAEVTEATPEAVADDPEEITPEAEAEALARINEKQNKNNHFVNVTAEDVKKEAEAIAADKLEIVSNDPEVIPPEIVRAKAIYKKLLSVNFTPTALQEAETDIIYKANKEALTPIAKRAGGLYMDTLSIIAAIMAIYSDIEA